MGSINRAIPTSSGLQGLLQFKKNMPLGSPESQRGEREAGYLYNSHPSCSGA